MADEGTRQSLQIDPAIEAVEIKITAREQDEDVVRDALESAHIEAERREIYFFDTHELALFDSGIVLRARLVHHGKDDSTVKLRPVVPSELSSYWKELDGFEVELDAVGDDAICSAKLTLAQDRLEIEEVAAGERELKKLFTGAQERLLEEHAPARTPWDDLSVLGPVDVRKWEVQPEGFDYEVTIEEWVLPDDSDLVELSVKANPADAAMAKDAFVELLRRRRIDTEGDSETKTRAVLRYFTTGIGID